MIASSHLIWTVFVCFCFSVCLFVCLFAFFLRPGSVVAEFKLTFKRELKDEQALAPLKEGIQDGKMGSLTVDPESLVVRKEKKGN